MNSKERKELAQWAVKQALSGGAGEAAVVVSNARSIDIIHRDGKLEELTESTQNSLNLDLYVDHKYSGHSTSDLSREALEPFIKEAVALTRFLEQDPYRTLTDPKYYAGRKDIDLAVEDKNYDAMTSDKRVSMAKALEEAGHSHGAGEDIVSCAGYYGDGWSQSIRVHSNGFEGEQTGTQHYNYCEVVLKDKDGGRPDGGYFGQSRFFEDLPSNEICGEEAYRRAKAKIGQKKLPSARYDMIIENRTAARVLAAFYSPMLGSNLSRKNSFLEGKIGEQIASPKLTMIDDPFVPRGMGSRLFDGDGISSQKRTIIEKGILKSYYIDNYYGRKLGMEPTSGGTSNIVVEYGDRDLASMIKGTKKGILVRSFLGGNSNSATGDFSFGIVGDYVEDGQIIHGVNEMNISGQLSDLWGQLAELGNDANVYSTWRLPSLYFKDVEFSGT